MNQTAVISGSIFSLGAMIPDAFSSKGRTAVLADSPGESR